MLLASMTTSIEGTTVLGYSTKLFQITASSWRRRSMFHDSDVLTGRLKFRGSSSARL
jgi:hypothetical protein